MNTNTSRLHVVDALRGFAIIAIMLLHNLEHFDYYFIPDYTPDWLLTLDKGVWDTLFFLFAGKSYAIFALLFGLTFYIQSHNRAQKNQPFNARFAWRLCLLLGFGLINSALFQGDILMIYAILGFGLIPVSGLRSSVVAIIALVLMLQPYEWMNFIIASQHPDMKLTDPASWAYFGRMKEYIPNGSFIDTLMGNLCNGRLAVLNWTWESGRVFQTLSLFMLGMLAGRKGWFEPTPANRSFWKKVLCFAVIAFIPLYLVKCHINDIMASEAMRRPFTTIISSWSNFVFMLVLVSTFVLVYPKRIGGKVLSVFAPIGCMSLSNYIFQSMLGSFIYYGFGLALYQYTGSTVCMLIGLTLGTMQGLLSAWWMKNHRRGPLEGIWHRLTWINSGRK